MTEIPAGLVPESFEMDPTTDDLLFDGNELRDGMVVLSDRFHAGYEKRTGYDEAMLRRQMREDARWCKASNVKLRTTRPVGGGEPMTFVEFIATYADGVKAKRSTGVVNGWYVKKNSVPATD